MKFLVFTLTFLACTHVSCYAQTDPATPKINFHDTSTRIYIKTDEEVAFPGGDSAWNNFLKGNLNTNVPVANGAPPGRYRVTMRFIVSRDGRASDITCEDDPGYGICEEALRVMKKIEKWIPAKKERSAVIAYRWQPIIFMVEPDLDSLFSKAGLPGNLVVKVKKRNNSEQPGRRPSLFPKPYTAAVGFTSAGKTVYFDAYPYQPSDSAAFDKALQHRAIVSGCNTVRNKDHNKNFTSFTKWGYYFLLQHCPCHTWEDKKCARLAKRINKWVRKV